MALLRKELEVLAAKMMDGSISPVEQHRLNEWLDEQMVKDSYELETSFATDAEDLRRRMLVRILEVAQPVKAGKGLKSPFVWWSSAAAAVIILVLGGIWFFDGRLQTENDQIKSVHADDIAPGGNSAVLTMADGSKVELSRKQNGIVIAGDVRYADGSAVLASRVENQESKDQTNSTEAVAWELMSITTPKGGTYQITLPDGSEVWLNAASTLKYPSRFSGSERVVELIGEAYFSIRESVKKGIGEKDKNSTKIPFKVMSAGQTVEVLGTEFNITAYPDETAIITTLIKGSVQLCGDAAGTKVSLIPNEQGVFFNGNITKEKVDVSTAIAWKEGFFAFDGLPPETAFAQLGRWYDMDVSYQGNIPQVGFFGIIERSKPLGTILKVLEKSGVKFKVMQEHGRNQLVVISE
ncbi:FecR family protein [Olivibacter sp. SDN3]|uniref:FecR family protein n=1 Tax=Olivibacter sp. SDN3 TaxID=2764720 RepID=UPI00165116B8|nr:FecR family protein [Olivibacter sp. SDN3]QNL47867.1 FecR family protein [Olivibacter sp. SDN3]